MKLFLGALRCKTDTPSYGVRLRIMTTLFVEKRMELKVGVEGDARRPINARSTSAASTGASCTSTRGPQLATWLLKAREARAFSLELT
jgi:hypothetical protein